MATTTSPIAHKTVLTYYMIPWIMVALLSDHLKKETR